MLVHIKYEQREQEVDYYGEKKTEMISVSVPNWETMIDFPDKALIYFKGQVQEDGRISSYTAYTEALDTVINIFLADHDIKKENLIDIKYQPSTEGMGDSALIIWDQ